MADVPLPSRAIGELTGGVRNRRTTSSYFTFKRNPICL